MRKYRLLSSSIFSIDKSSRLEVPSSSTTLHYKGQTLDVPLEHFETLRVLGSGCYGTVLAVMIRDHPDVQMAVKVGEIGLNHRPLKNNNYEIRKSSWKAEKIVVHRPIQI